MGINFVEPSGSAEIAAFDALCWDYLAFLRSQTGPFRAALDIVYSDAIYAAALAKRPAPPHGLQRLALCDDQALGCGTIQTFQPGDAEIKRVFVAPGARGTGMGRALMAQLITDCRALGFSRILMDTGAPLIAAQRLYDQLGFMRRDPYAPGPARDAFVYFEMEL
ncbi:MAG: GNAT family N-acetyltransferase [Pseudomonadota bacterium]